MSKTSTRAEPGAGHPFLTFLNTVVDDGKTRQLNSFQNAAVLVKLLEQEGFEAPPEALSDTQLANILTLREVAHAAFSAISMQKPAAPADAQFLTTALKSVYNNADFDISALGLQAAPSPVSGLYEQLVLSMDDLMRSENFGRLRECRRCTHMFLDLGRGVGRRWCSMAKCGNRAKAESFRARRKAA